MRSARRVPLLLIAVLGVLLGACADDGELGGPAVGGTLAAKVGDVEIGSDDLEEEVELWALSPQFLQAIGVNDPGPPGRRTTDLVSFVLSHRILSEQARLLSEGYEPRPEEIDQILASIDQNFTTPGAEVSLFGAYPDPFRRRLARDLAYQNNAQRSFGPGTVAPPVEVNPKYGDAELLQGGLVQVTRPAGPLPAPARRDA